MASDMRKILVGVLSVAGLLTAVVALASGPATAAKQVLTITSDTEPGTYTVTWSTGGGCNPGAGTSGATGSRTLTVADSGDGTGTAEETGVTIDDICSYEWSGFLDNEDGSRCKVADITFTDGAATLDALDDCNTVETVTFTVVGYTTPASAGTAAVPPTAAVTGAIANTAFTVTATEKVPAGAKADPECATVSDDTEISAAGHNEVSLTLVDATFSGRNCIYTVTAALPSGFAAGAAGSNSAVVVMNGAPDDGADPANNRATLDDPPDSPSTVALRANLGVTVATRTVYLVQNVIGDAGGVGVEYDYSASCGAPGLPGALGPRTGAGGGIIITPPMAVVELREGRFNVSGGIGDNTAGGTKAYALNEKAEACEAAVTVSGVPSGCSVVHNSPVDLVSAGDSVIIEFTIDCASPVALPGEGDELVDLGGGEGVGGGAAGPPQDMATG